MNNSGFSNTLHSVGIPRATDVRGSNAIAAALGLFALFVVAACDRRTNASRADTDTAAGNNTSPTDSARPQAGTGWTADAGAFLILPTVDGGTTSGSLIRPEATDSTVEDTVGVGKATGDGRIDLFSRTGKVGEARMSVDRALRSDSGCTAWPIARLTAVGAAPRGWTAAFAQGKVVAVALDSIEGFASKDSAALAANVTRLASALPDDTVSTFRGLPFVVLRAWRASSGESAFIVALLVRRVNQEDAPREERLVLVVDAKGADANSWRVAWLERASGHEDELVVAEPLLAFQFAGRGAIHLLFGRDDGEALSAAMLVKDAKGWHMQWESALAGCDR